MNAIYAALTLFLTFVIGMAAYDEGKEYARKMEHKKAIQAGVGKYIPDADGKLEFQYIRKCG